MWSIRGKEDAGGFWVECRSLDDLADELGPPDLIKIDVEEAELEVIQGGKALLALRRDKPLMIVEMSSTASRASVQRLLPDIPVEPLGERHLLVG